MNYKDLQSALKIARTQGLTTIKLNLKKDALQAEYNRLYGTQTPAPAPAPEPAPAPAPEAEQTRRSILAKLIAEANDDMIDILWDRLMNTPAPAPTPEPAPEAGPTDDEILAKVIELDTELGTENYLEIYHLRNAFPGVKRGYMNDALYRLQKSNRIDFSTLQETTAYTPQQIDAGIPQIIGGQLFFIIHN